MCALKNGTKWVNGATSVEIIDQDRLCYQVKSVSNGTAGIRTISKALLKEWVDGRKNYPYVQRSTDLRDLLKGKSEIDRFEYGYESTLWKLTELELGEVGDDISSSTPPPISSTSFSPYLAAIRTKPFVLLAGISGTGKSRIVRRLAQASVTYELQCMESPELKDKDTFEKMRFSIHKPANFELIQVKPNWHNSMDVVGYRSNIPNPHYVLTPFVRFVAKAWQHPNVPFFLCLDEMNLAPVEEYFAEFLSAIESRSKGVDNTYQTDPIIDSFKQFGEAVSDEMLDALIPNAKASNVDEIKKLCDQFVNHGLSLPENLIVIGTVNMDETTFTFSRKVLDRAMSFEMNEVDFDAFMNGKSDLINEKLTDDEIKELIDRPVDREEVKGNVDAEAVVGYIKAVNDCLDGTPFKLGYRALNEALLYVDAARIFGKMPLATALDDFTMMKILSRVEGDSGKLAARKDSGKKTLLDELGSVIEAELKKLLPKDASGGAKDGEGASGAEGGEDAKDDVTDGEKGATKPSRDFRSLKKLTRMSEQLDRNSFVSYWE